MRFRRSHRTHEDAERSYELAQAARAYSRRTKKNLDDKLTFAAALMRAGEAQGAAEILDQIEDDLKNEQASLYETAAASSKAKVPVGSRVATAALGLAVAGTSILGLSAAGMAAAGAFNRRPDVKLGTGLPPSTRMVAGPAASADRSRVEPRASKRRAVKHMKVAGVSFALNARQQRRFDRLTSAKPVDRVGLTSLLRQVMSESAVQRVDDVLASVPHVAVVEPDATSLPQQVSSGLPAASGKDSGNTGPASSGGNTGTGTSGGNTGTGTSGGGHHVGPIPLPSPTVDHLKVNLAPPKL